MSNWQHWRPIRRQYLWRYDLDSGCVVILLPEKTLRLNDVASMIWEQLEGDRLVGHIVEAVHARYPRTSLETVTDEVLRFLMLCHADKLIYLHWEPLR